MLISTTKLAKLKGVTSQTVRRWIESGKYKAVKTDGGHFRVEYKNEQKTICYGRVSSKKQISSIKTQKNLLKEKYPEAEFVYDIGSGFNFKRQNFVKLLDRCLHGDAIKIVSTTPDRISRSGLTLICKIVEFYGGEIIFLENNNKIESFDTSTLISFLTSFCNSQSGKRNSRHNKKNKNIPTQ